MVTLATSFANYAFVSVPFVQFPYQPQPNVLEELLQSISFNLHLITFTQKFTHIVSWSKGASTLWLLDKVYVANGK